MCAGACSQKSPLRALLLFSVRFAFGLFLLSRLVAVYSRPYPTGGFQSGGSSHGRSPRPLPRGTVTTACHGCPGPRPVDICASARHHMPSAPVCGWNVQLQASGGNRRWPHRAPAAAAAAPPSPHCCLRFIPAPCRLSLVLGHGQDL